MPEEVCGHHLNAVHPFFQRHVVLKDAIRRYVNWGPVDRYHRVWSG